MAVAQPLDQLAKRGETAPPQLLRVAGGRHAVARLRDDLDPAEDREKTGERADVARHQRVSLGERQRVQVAAEAVNEVIERLVRYRLALVASPLEHHDVRFALAQLL